jgi:hypothetical protein
MASNAGNDEIILLFSAREYKKISKMFDFEAKAGSPNRHRLTRYRYL